MAASEKTRENKFPAETSHSRHAYVTQCLHVFFFTTNLTSYTLFTAFLFHSSVFPFSKQMVDYLSICLAYACSYLYYFIIITNYLANYLICIFQILLYSSYAN